MVKNNQLVTEISLFNEYKTFQNITVVEQYDQKLVLIKPNVRKDKQFNTMYVLISFDWVLINHRNEIINVFSDTTNEEQTLWPKTFKNYYLTYDKVMKVKFSLKSSILTLNSRDNQEKRWRAIQEKSFIQRSMPKLKPKRPSFLKITLLCNSSSAWEITILSYTRSSLVNISSKNSVILLTLLSLWSYKKDFLSKIFPQRQKTNFIKDNAIW